MTLAIRTAVFRRSSAVEQLTVNQLVVGSIPTAGAKNPYKNSYLPRPPLAVFVLLDPPSNQLASKPKASGERSNHLVILQLRLSWFYGVAGGARYVRVR